MLGKAAFPLTKAQVGNFILEKEYTNYLTLQQVIAELIDADLIDAKSSRNRTLLAITDEGRETLSFFENRINDSIKKDIGDFFSDNEMEMRNEVSILSDYYKAVSGEYEAHMLAKEKGVKILEITLSVPDEDTASAICANWQNKNQDIYQYIIKKLF